MTREIAARAGALITFDLELASFEAPGVAREAWLCVVEDGETLAAICHRAGGRLERRRRFLDALPDGLRGAVLSARPGDVLPPVATENGHVICRVVEKRSPGIDDDDVRKRVETALCERAIDDLIDAHVRWSRG